MENLPEWESLSNLDPIEDQIHLLLPPVIEHGGHGVVGRHACRAVLGGRADQERGKAHQAQRFHFYVCTGQLSAAEKDTKPTNVSVCIMETKSPIDVGDN